MDFATLGAATLSGNIWDDADPQFNNYTYQYHIKHSQIALKGKLLGNLGWPVMPWIGVQLRELDLIESYGFTNTPVNL